MSLEEAVYRLTGKTALMHDITDRGFIAAGKVADITIFDPDTIAPKPREPLATLPAGGVQVKRDAVGIDKVIVNGTVLLENGELTGALPGQIIRGGNQPVRGSKTRNRGPLVVGRTESQRRSLDTEKGLRPQGFQ